MFLYLKLSQDAEKSQINEYSDMVICGKGWYAGEGEKTI